MKSMAFFNKNDLSKFYSNLLKMTFYWVFTTSRSVVTQPVIGNNTTTEQARDNEDARMDRMRDDDVAAEQKRHDLK